MRLHGVKSNSHAVGASVLLTLSDSKGGPRTVLREMGSVSHETDWLGQRDDRIVFGLGELGVPERLVIRWPTGKTQTIGDVHKLRSSVGSMTDPLVTEEAS